MTACAPLRTVVTPQGTSKILVEYRDAEIVQERQQAGRRVGEVKYDCKIVKVSDADYGEDLAVLMVRCKGAYPLSVCAKFHRDINYIPPIGVDLSHCGSLLGQFGANSYTTGVLSQTGRICASLARLKEIPTASLDAANGELTTLLIGLRKEIESQSGALHGPDVTHSAFSAAADDLTTLLQQFPVTHETPENGG